MWSRPEERKVLVSFSGVLSYSLGISLPPLLQLGSFSLTPVVVHLTAVSLKLPHLGFLP